MAKKILSTPQRDNFFVFPDFPSHHKCWIVWPERTDKWRLGAKPAQKIWVKIIKEISQYESINVLVSAKQFQNARKQLPEEVRVLETTTNDVAIRDYGPIFLVNKETKVIRGLKSEFNSWGGFLHGIYFPWDADDLVSYKMFEYETIDYYELPIVLEWSMILFDGEGTCFVSEEGVLSPLRNSCLSKKQAEFYLTTYLNVKNIIWIPYGLPYDLAKGRITNIITIVNSHTVLLSWTDDHSDERYFAVKMAYDILKNAVNCNNQKYEIIKIPLPKNMYRTKSETEMIDYNQYHTRPVENEILIASYTSLYITKNIVLMPIYNDEINDEKVFHLYCQIFKNKAIIKIDVRELILGNNNIDNIICPQISIFKGKKY